MRVVTNGIRSGEFGIIRCYPPGIELFSQHEAVDEVYLVHEGVVKQVWAHSSGHETVVGLCWPGAFLGSAARIKGVPHLVSAVTLTVCRIERIYASDFSELIESDPRFSRMVHQSHSNDVLELARSVGELACVSSRVRLEAFFKRVYSSVGRDVFAKDGRLTLPVKRKDLAAMIQITPEHLSRVLGELADERVIELRDHWIVLREVEKLRDGT